MSDTQQTPPQPPTPPAQSHANDKLFAAFAYVGILFLVPLLATSNRSPFLRHHLQQGIALFVVGLLVMLVQRMISWQIGGLLNLVVGVVAIVAIVKVVQGETWEIPVIGEYAKGIKV